MGQWTAAPDPEPYAQAAPKQAARVLGRVGGGGEEGGAEGGAEGGGAAVAALLREAAALGGGGGGSGGGGAKMLLSQDASTLKMRRRLLLAAATVPSAAVEAEAATTAATAAAAAAERAKRRAVALRAAAAQRTARLEGVALASAPVPAEVRWVDDLEGLREVAAAVARAARVGVDTECADGASPSPVHARALAASPTTLAAPLPSARWADGPSGRAGHSDAVLATVQVPPPLALPRLLPLRRPPHHAL